MSNSVSSFRHECQSPNVKWWWQKNGSTASHAYDLCRVVSLRCDDGRLCYSNRFPYSLRASMLCFSSSLHSGQSGPIPSITKS